MREEISETSRRVAEALREEGADPADWGARPEREVTFRDASGRVEITLQGFKAVDVQLDPYWLKEESYQKVEEVLADAITGALTALVDAEIESARNTSYEQADVQAKLIQISQALSGTFRGQIDDLLGGLR